MVYVTQDDVEAFCGYGYNDFKQGGFTMEEAQWEAYCNDDLIPRIEAMVLRFCGVASFFEHTVIEYKNSPGMDSLDDYLGYMAPGGQAVPMSPAPEFLLNERCIEVSSVEIKPWPWMDVWESVLAVSSDTTGEYYTAEDSEITHVYLARYPQFGSANIRITYNAGYEPGSDQIQEIKLIILRIIRINLEEKLKFQQAGTIRNTNVRDYMEMYDIDKNQHHDQYYIPEDIVRELKRYQRLMVSQVI